MVNLHLSWLILIVAGVFEALWVFYLKKSGGFTQFNATILFIITLIISMVLLSLAMKSLPMSVAYPVWTGIGAIGSVIIGWWIFNETITLPLMISFCFVIVGIVGIKVFS
ncbi:MAG: multidrug efflux SMR transporter [Bdellovibrionales bacterium]|nr:multidrug efflux SMR transporter [Bdellovibrionales bacterium]